MALSTWLFFTRFQLLMNISVEIVLTVTFLNEDKIERIVKITSI